MAAALSTLAPTGDLVRSSESGGADTAEFVATAAQPTADGSSNGWNPVITRLPIELDVAVPVRGFKVRDLIGLGKGQVVESQWGHADDLPLAARQTQLAWCEFEVIETRLAVRVTRLA